MKQQIIENINNPGNLEIMFRDNRQEFIQSFNEISDNYKTDLVKFWKIRLAHETESDFRGFRTTDLLVVIIISLITGILVKLRNVFPQIESELFYTRYLAMIVFNGIILYTFWQKKIFEVTKILFHGLIFLILLVFVNFLPFTKSDSINLALIHLPLFLWCLFGITFISFDYQNTYKRIDFIRFNGELLIMTGLLLIVGGLLTGITIGLFSVIQMDIQKFYFNNVAIIGGVASPVVAYYLIGIYPNITSKIGPVIARVFAPLVMLTLLVYLFFVIFSNSKILEDRELLIIFNIVLLVVMAIIVFSVTELDKLKERNANVLVLFALAILAIIINSIALYAITSRVFDGITPNRTVVLLSNILIFVHLVLITMDLYKSYFKIKNLDSVEKTVANYLTLYWIYTILVIFILPFMFGFK